MSTFDLNEFARSLAIYAHSQMRGIHRGALLIRCTTDSTTAAAVFGNDNYRLDDKSRREVTYVRNNLREAGLEELGFALSPDCFSWALLVRARHATYQTEVGRRFQYEMLKVYLDHVVWESWWNACGVAPDSPERLAPEKYHFAQ